MEIRQYKDYSEWMKNRDLSQQRDFWLNLFVGEIPILNMPFDFPRPKVKSFKGDIVKCKIEKSLGEKILKLARETENTEYIIFLSAVMILLAKYSRQEDIVIGSPASARVHKDLDNMLGMFTNTLALRGRPCANKIFLDFLTEIKALCLRAYDNQEYPFEELVNSLDVTRDFSRNPLFDVFLTFESNTLDAVCFEGIELEPLELETHTAKFDISFFIRHTNDGYDVNVEYCTDLFKKESVENLLTHYVRILEEITKNENILIGDIEIASQTEKEVINKIFNNTDRDYKNNKTIIELFEEQVKKDSDKVAVICNSETITYGELNRRANGLAKKLKEYGVEREVFVAIIAKRSLEMIVGIYAVLKAGGVVVPIAPGYPQNRIGYIINDCMPKVILKHDVNISFEDIIKETSCNVLDLADQKNYVMDSDDIESSSTLEDAVYCIYTSGTTGKPKGVININKGLTNRILWMQDRYPIDETDIILQKTVYTFDVSVWEIFWWGIAGATVSLLPDGTEKDPSEICKAIKDTGVTVIHFVPSMLNIFLSYIDSLDKQEVLSHIKYIFSSGEALNPCTVSKTLENLLLIKSHAKLVNLYGPTEASIDVTYFECKNRANLVPIGKPISNIKIYILDHKERMTGIGVPGEICIAGVGLAREYLNREKLTRDKFTDNPFGQGKIYHTGDYGRWLSDGNIEYLGRVDEQVKIRGFRIELGEIENQLRNINNISDCAVIVREDDKGEKNIFAYVVAKERIDINEIKNELKENMPAYMIPSYIGLLDKIPLTINGKLDKKLLNELDNICDKEYIEPRNEVERAIANIWKEILNIDRVSVEDNFFEIGGNSLSFIRVYFQINLLYPNIIKIVDLFSYYTIRSIANYILEVQNGRNQHIEFNALSNEYINRDEKIKQSTRLKFILNENDLTKYNQLISSGSITNDSFIKAVYTCLLEEITEEENIVFLFSEDGVNLETINIDMKKVDDIKDLERIIKLKICNKNSFNMSILRFIEKKGNQKEYLIPLIIENGVEIKNFDDYFDIILSYSYSDTRLEFEIVFSDKIANNKYSEIVKSFYGYFSGALEEYCN